MHLLNVFFTALLAAILLPQETTAFTPSSRAARVDRIKQQEAPTTLGMGLFGSEGNPLAGIFGGESNSGGGNMLWQIPAKEVKIGALRFLLQIYLVGEQNKPTQNSWLTKQGDEGDLQVYFSDGTGMVSLDLQENSITAVRYGQKPSLQYQLQESVLLHGVLDELNNVVFDVDDIEEDKRLLRLADNDAIYKARQQLPARKA